jgi:hypothetical protein
MDSHPETTGNFGLNSSEYKERKGNFGFNQEINNCLFSRTYLISKKTFTFIIITI